MLKQNDILEFEILEHIESDPHISNRIIAEKLGCSVKLAHTLLGKISERGLVHIKKQNARRWDYFLTPKGVAQKAKLTYEFLNFSMRFYHEARKNSSQVCRNMSEKGIKTVAFIGAGELAEIAFLGVKEWNLELIEIFDDTATEFLGHNTLPLAEYTKATADAILICLYDKKNPMSKKYITNGITKNNKMYWIF